MSSKGHIKNTHLYGTLFIDEFTINGIGNPETEKMQIGFTLGSSVTDLPIDNLTLKLEYSKIYPYVYQHYINTTTFESALLCFGTLDE